MAFHSNKLKELRKAHGLSQRDLAEKIKVSKSSVSMYESGARNPDFETLEAICDFFNIGMDVLSDNNQYAKLNIYDKTHDIVGFSQNTSTNVTDEEVADMAKAIENKLRTAKAPDLLDIVFQDDPDTLSQIKNVSYNGAFIYSNKLCLLTPQQIQILQTGFKQLIDKAVVEGQTEITINLKVGGDK